MGTHIGDGTAERTAHNGPSFENQMPETEIKMVKKKLNSMFTALDSGMNRLHKRKEKCQCMAKPLNKSTEESTKELVYV